MRKLSRISIAALVFLIACNSTRKPSYENFAKAIDEYLAKHGEACTSIGHQFPIDIPASAQQAQYGFGPQLTALQQVGLVTETDTTAVAHKMLDALRGSTSPRPVKRFQLTAKGQKYFRQVPGTFGQTGGLCYGHKAVESILKWSDPAMTNGSFQTEVTYTYKLVNLASWAKMPEIQQAFPDIEGTVGGVSKASHLVGLQLTSNGWKVLDH